MEINRHKKKGGGKATATKADKAKKTMVEPLRFTVVRKSAGAAGKDGGTVGGARQLLLPASAPNKNTWFQLFHPIKCCKKEEEGRGGEGGREGVTTTTPPPTQCNPGHQHCRLKQKGEGGGGGGSFTQELDGRQLLDHLGKSSLIGRAQWVGEGGRGG